MPPAMGNLIKRALKLTRAAGEWLYAGLAVMSGRADGPRTRLRWDPRDPTGSAKNLLVWLGVNALAVTIRTSVVLWNMLAEASADVGEWLLRRGGAGLERSFRSRFTI
jgi:hypothetical protein